eukprot:TRINITY_DN11644_c0_g1_i1.p1 TRINITY_DN11644_c0_g1~~TRINITY_DN11644_c0_g1_i1.p1  ORF type:complete len:233 (-),score=50.82 TRINITY_DN11644_c0_g1_i1:231-929(-)
MSVAKRERMKLLTAAAFDKGKGEDSFGANDADWQMYNKMAGKEVENEEDEEEEAELNRIGSRLQELDPSFRLSTAFAAAGGEAPGIAAPRPPRRATEEDYQVSLRVERVRAAEVLFSPSMIAIDQAGLGELLTVALRRTPDELRARVAAGNVFVTGGNVLLPGLLERVRAEVTKTRPLGSRISVVPSWEPARDAWRGAAMAAKRPKCPFMTKHEYEEEGGERLKRFDMRYSQ